MNINLHIERLVLDGIDVGSNQSKRLQASITSELTQLLSCGNIAPSLTSEATLKSVSASSIQLNDTKQQILGQQIAQSVYGGISHE